MAFAPNSSIWLCTVPFDNTYKNQVRFPSAQLQTTYFTQLAKKTFSEYVVVRKTLPDGGVRSSVKVEANIDDLYGYNYMFYRNANHGTRNFYCFITDLIYVNEGTTEIVFETDVYQTWLFDVQILESFVVREHSETDEIGDHIVPEPLNFTDYIYKETTLTSDNADTALVQWGYLIGTSVFVSTFDNLSVSRGRDHSGIYQGVYFYFFTNPANVNAFLDAVEQVKEDSVLFITLAPYFSVGTDITKIFETEMPRNGYVNPSTAPAEAYLELKNNPFAYDNYTVKNNKLFSSQFCCLAVSNNSGSVAEYNFEDFYPATVGGTVKFGFDMYGDISASPSVVLVPRNYKGSNHNMDEAISIANFPQCSFHSDTFKLWLAKNQYTNALNVIGGVGSMAVGAVGMYMSGGMIGGGEFLNGAMSIANTINSAYQASRAPNRATVERAKNNLLTSISKNCFTFYIKRLKTEHAKTVDDYFTMYGYQTNRVKVPNRFSRPKFNYVQTIDVNIAPITGGIPCDDMVRLKKVYNDGVTLWASSATVGDYSVDNSPQ